MVKNSSPYVIAGKFIALFAFIPTRPFLPVPCLLMGTDSSVGIATAYRLDGPEIESRWRGEIFRTRPDRPRGPSSLLYNGYRLFARG